MATRPGKINVIKNCVCLFLLCFYFVGCQERKSRKSEDSKKVTFELYYQEFKNFQNKPDVQITSDIRTHINCEPFRQIIAGGKDNLPFIIEKIRDGDFFLNYAMEEITGVSICEYFKKCKEQKLVSEQDYSILWLEWWDEQKKEY